VVEVAACPEEPGGIIRVRDDGPGIPAELLDRVFDPYFSTKPKGSGIGLALCKRLVEQSGGGIRIDSTTGAGTVVTVSLPGSRGA
jgi:signal transduction histidine kinase